MKIVLLVFVVKFLVLSPTFADSGADAKQKVRYSCLFKAKSEQKSFHYDSSQEVGKNIKLAEHELLLWHKEGFFMVKVRGGVFVKPLSIQFGLGQQTIRFNLKPNVDLTCVLQEAPQQKKLTRSSALDEFDKNITFKILKNLSFRAHQREETQLMRTLFFQNGNIYINSKDMERKLPWCSLRVQLKQKKDTQIKPGEEFKPLSFQKQENNSYFTTFSYSFVDSSSGQKRGETESYSPFTFSCNILRGMPYTLENFKAIVGDFLTLGAGSSL